MNERDWNRMVEAWKHPQLDHKPSIICPRTGGDHETLGLIGRGEYPDGSVTRIEACVACGQTLREVRVVCPAILVKS